MNAIRRLSWGTLVVAIGHIVFGAIVRITGSGMGCGEHWPKCHGYWFPPLDRPDLIVEVSHRYFAATLTALILVTLAVAWNQRRAAGVGGKDGVLRPLTLAAGLVVAAALFGAVTVFLALANKAVIVTHLAIAMSLLATLVVAIVRAGAPPRIEKYDSARHSPSSFPSPPSLSNAADPSTPPNAAPGTLIAAALAFATLVLGGLTANIPGANTACTGFPLCDGGLLPTDPSQHIQFTHRLFAFALLFDLIAVAIGTRRTARVFPIAVLALGTVVAQVLVALAMIALQLPPVWRSLHEAVGTIAWVAICFLAYVARHAAAPHRTGPIAVGSSPATDVRSRVRA